jgi:hypothetical protein
MILQIIKLQPGTLFRGATAERGDAIHKLVRHHSDNLSVTQMLYMRENREAPWQRIDTEPVTCWSDQFVQPVHVDITHEDA